MQLNKSPDRDLITSFWYKNIYYCRDKLTVLYQSTYNGEEHSQPWLPQARTKWLLKNEITNVAKNYRPIACLNIMYKIYISFWSTFLSDHYCKNQIISPESNRKEGCLGLHRATIDQQSNNGGSKEKRHNLFTI